MITHTINGAVRPRVAVARREAPDTRLDEAVTLRRCAMYRKAFRGSAVSFPVDVLRSDAVAEWIRAHGITVDVACTDDVDRVRVAGIDALHVVMHCRGEVPVAICRSGFPRFVVDSGDQVARLADAALDRPQRIVVDAAQSDELAAAVNAHERVELVGLHSRISDTDEGQLADTVVGTIAKMARIRRRHGAVLSCVSLGDVAVQGAERDPRALRRLACIVDQAVEDGCIRYRYPRPALTVSPRESVLLPD